MDNVTIDLNASVALELELAERELQAALIFAKFSSTSYSTGNLQRATDARSKAKAVCDRAAKRLAAHELRIRPDSVKRIWTEVQTALAALTTPQFRPRTHAAGGLPQS